MSIEQQIKEINEFWSQTDGKIIQDSGQSYTDIIAWAKNDTKRLATIISQQSAEIERHKESFEKAREVLMGDNNESYRQGFITALRYFGDPFPEKVQSTDNESGGESPC